MLRELRSDVRGFCEGLCGFTAADWGAFASIAVGVPASYWLLWAVFL